MDAKERERALGLTLSQIDKQFGKGSVQHLYNNADESKLKLTVAHYLTPGDRSIQSVGIPPDIELVPQVIQWREIEATDDVPARQERWITLLWRDRLSREADLERHLDGVEALRDKPTYRVPYLFHVDEDDEERRFGKRDLDKDWEVQLAREVLLSAAQARRADILAAVSPLLEKKQQQQAEKIRAAFKDLQIDWTAGTQPPNPSLHLEVDLGEDGILVPGEEEEITVRLTNQGEEDLFQVFAVTESDNEWFDENEYFFGRIQPGETREATRWVKLAQGFSDEVDSVRFKIRDPLENELGDTLAMVRSRGRPLPSFRWQLALFDDGSGESQGDGDGVPEVGEVIDLQVEILNTSQVAGGDVFVNLKNEAGRDVDLREGVLEFGALEPGVSASGRFTFEVRGEGEAGWLELELQVGDNDCFDYGAILRGGFYDLVSQRQRLRLPVAPGLGQETWAGPHEPPQLEITRRPPVLVSEPAVVVSGVLRDDRGLRDIIVYHDDKKVYYQGGAGLGSIPFSVERKLEAAACYHSQLAFLKKQHKAQFIELHRAQSIVFGSYCGAEAAEGFCTSPAWNRLVAEGTLPE